MKHVTAGQLEKLFPHCEIARKRFRKLFGRRAKISIENYRRWEKERMKESCACWRCAKKQSNNTGEFFLSRALPEALCDTYLMEIEELNYEERIKIHLKYLRRIKRVTARYKEK